MLCINDVDPAFFREKKVLVRVDFNVPISNDYLIEDNSRIKSAMQTIKFLKNAGSKVILISHFGRPINYDMSKSLYHIKDEVSNLLGDEVKFCHDTIGLDATNSIANTAHSNVLLLENLRFSNGEVSADPSFANSLANLADIYVNEAFSVSHRAHASIVLLPKILPSFAGFSFKKEINSIDNYLNFDCGKRMCIIGGSKLESKIGMIVNLVSKVNYIVVGGTIAFVFASYLNGMLSKFFDKSYGNICESVIESAKKHNCTIIVPDDFLYDFHLKDGFGPLDYRRINDVGMRSTNKIINCINSCDSILWNGPLGVYENEPFSFSSQKIATHIAKMTKIGKLTSIVGGGNTVSLLNSLNISDDFTYISNAGGAFLEYIEGKSLPGVVALEENLRFNNAALVNNSSKNYENFYN